jgi:Cell wall-associated hydrolases (invasion-associated proteins)
MKHRFARLTTAALCCTALALGTVASIATGSPIEDKRAEAQRLQQQIDANGMKISSLGEQYNGAQLALDQATARVDAAEQRLTEARRSTLRIERSVKHRASALYMSSGQSTPLDAINVTSVRDVAAREKYAAAASDHDSKLIETLLRSRDQLRIQRAQFKGQQRQAQAQRDAAVQARASIETANARQSQLLSQVKGQIASLMAEDQKRRDDEARRSAIARTQPRPAPRRVDPGTAGGNFPDVPTSGSVAAVIAYARAQIGKPYIFATAGPDTFDCSGLTMMAWRQAGVSMAHFSGAQFNQFPHISISQLQPGDLVFKGPGGADHVALYIGGGMQIAATHTGSYVLLQPLGSGLSGAVRPG